MTYLQETYHLDDVIEFGKYEGEKTIRDLMRDDPAYLAWLVDNVEWFDYIDE